MLNFPFIVVTDVDAQLSVYCADQWISILDLHRIYEFFEKEIFGFSFF